MRTTLTALLCLAFALAGAQTGKTNHSQHKTVKHGVHATNQKAKHKTKHKSNRSTRVLSSRHGVRLPATMEVTVTAYYWREGGLRTALGNRVTKGAIAVDPRVIPFGTRMYIPGYGEGVACDTGGLIKGNIIDVAFDTKGEVNRWGKRRLTIQILGR
ncbi:MAG: 3D domain-containing protein [Armatimonadetes bacterium]|nr:3D domain-containing protein [Armatimonadota bacterium]